MTVMSNNPNPCLCDGPQDCGSFFLDAVGRFSPEDLHVGWSDEARPTAPDVEEFIDKFWNRRTAQAAAEGTSLWDGPLCRLIEYRCDTKGLGLSLGPTSYRAFVGTNLHNAHLRYVHGPEVLANPLGVSGVVVSEGQYIVMGRRSETVAYHAGRVQPIGGCVEPAKAGQLPDPFAAMKLELLEELGITAESIKSMTCLGLVRDKHIVQPELIFDVPVAIGVEQIRELAAQSHSSSEHTELRVVRNHPASVVTYIEKEFSLLTPVALASLLLYGLTHWGSGWFASTRGYLRSLI